MVEPVEAKQDRILVGFDHWDFTGTADEFRRFADRLASALPLDVYGDEVSDGGDDPLDPPHRRLFTKPSGAIPIWAKWPVSGRRERTGYRTPAGAPLFSGNLRAYRIEGGNLLVTHRGRWRIRADLALNPTRWLRFEDHGLFRVQGDWLAVPPRMFAHGGRQADGEVALVPGSNYIPGTQRAMALSNPSRWPIHLRRYVHGVLETINTALAIAASASDGNLERTTGATRVREIETYWEYSATDPIETVTALERPLRALSSRSSLAWWPVSEEAVAARKAVSISTDDNSPVVRIKLAAGIFLRVYAKTTGRLRLEVVHQCNEAKGFSASGGQTVARLFRWVEHAALDAATRVNRVLRSFETLQQLHPQSSHPPHQLLTAAHVALKSATIAGQLVGLLVTEGRLVKSSRSTFGAFIDQLASSGIIERAEQTGAEHVYVVTERYRWALARLQAADREGIR